MDEILNDVCVDSLSPAVVFGNGDDGGGGHANKTVTVSNEIVRVGVGGDSLGLFGGIESANQQSCVGQHGVVETSPDLVIGNVKERGKRKAVMEPVADIADQQQKQKRMMDDRESAEGKQQRHPSELEKQAMQLEEERAQLLRKELHPSELDKQAMQLEEERAELLQKERSGNHSMTSKSNSTTQTFRPDLFQKSTPPLTPPTNFHPAIASYPPALAPPRPYLAYDDRDVIGRALSATDDDALMRELFKQWLRDNKRWYGRSKSERKKHFEIFKASIKKIYDQTDADSWKGIGPFPDYNAEDFKRRINIALQSGGGEDIINQRLRNSM